MLKQDLLSLIEEFIKETWKYNDNFELDNDMEYIYKIEEELKKNENIDIKQISSTLLAIIGIIRFKYGFESIVIKNNPDLNVVRERIKSISLNSEYIIDEYYNIKEMYMTYIKSMTSIDFLGINNISNENGLYLAVQSLGSLITNNNYRMLLKDEQIGEILIDCIKLIYGISRIETIEPKYKDIIKKIWNRSLLNSSDTNSFRMLFSNISGGSLTNQAHNLINRPNQSSCSMISSNFIATYGSCHRRIGFVYPSDSNIIMVSAYDLGSNVFGTGVKNKEKGTSLVTPEVLERVGIERTKEKGEDLLFSSCYNEVLVDSQPCGILIIGFGENDLNIDDEDAIKLANELKLPLYKIDVLDYKDELSESDKEYIAYHCVLSFMGIDAETMNQLVQNGEADEVVRLINDNKNAIVQQFIELKKSGLLNKENMFLAITEIMTASKDTDVTR